MKSARKKLMNHPGRIDMGKEPLDEETAKTLNKMITEIDSGKVNQDIPSSWEKLEKKVEATKLP